MLDLSFSSKQKAASKRKGAAMRSKNLKTTEECLKAFVGKFNLNSSKRSDIVLRDGLIRLFNISRASGYRWFGRCEVPIGENLALMRTILSRCGLHVAEEEKLGDELKAVIRMVALKLVTTEEVAKHFNVTKNTVLRWVTARNIPVANQEDKLTEFVSARVEPLRQKLEEVTASLADLGFADSTSAPVASLPVTSSPGTPAVAPTSSPKFDTVAVLAHLILAAKPLAEKVVSDDFTPADRERLRELTKNCRSHAVFDLQVQLYRLCSELAREKVN